MSGIVVNVFYAAEPLLMAIALVALLCAKERKRFPALLTYFVLRLTSFVALACLLHVHLFAHVPGLTIYGWYFYTYWSLYMAGAIAIFFVIQELFNYALEPLPGLKRLGSLAFRWVAGLSFVAATASALYAPPAGLSIPGRHVRSDHALREHLPAWPFALPDALRRQARPLLSQPRLRHQLRLRRHGGQQPGDCRFSRSTLAAKT